MTQTIARWSIRHPWWAIGLWLAFVATAVVLGGMTETRQLADDEGLAGESGRAEQIVASAGFDEPATESVLITAPPELARAAAADVAGRLGAMPEVAEVGEPVPSAITDALLVPVTLSGDPETAADRVAPVLAALDEIGAEHGVRVETVGGASGEHGVDAVVEEDLSRAGLLSVPVTLGIMLLAFGAFIAAGIPVLLALSAVFAATGMYAVASHAFPDFGAVPHVILLIGLAVGVDYTLFYLKREREERRRGAGHVDAVTIAAATSGRAVVVSGIAVLVSMAGLFLAGDAIFAGLATGAMLVVGVAVLGSLTVLPALLVKLGRAVDRPKVPLLWRLTNRDSEPRLWPWLLKPALRAPRTTLVLTLAAMAALAAPALNIHLKLPGVEDLPRSIPVVDTYHRLLAAFPSEGNAHLVVVRAPASEAGAVRTALLELADRAAADPLFTPAEPEVRLSADQTVSTIELPIPYEVDAPEAERSLALLRAELVPATVGAVPGAEHAVGGDPALNLDASDNLAQRLPWVIAFVVGLTMLMMVFAFRSVVVALVAGLLNVISVVAAFGLLTMVFGTIVTWVPLFLFVILFGLSMDYHVFVVSRIREAASHMDTRAAIREGIVRTAGVVTSAAAVMVAVFSIFATLSLIELRQMGVGLAAAIAIDATVVRILLLPSVMALLGRANWWPSAPDRVHVATAPVPPVYTVAARD